MSLIETFAKELETRTLDKEHIFASLDFIRLRYRALYAKHWTPKHKQYLVLESLYAISLIHRNNLNHLHVMSWFLTNNFEVPDKRWTLIEEQWRRLEKDRVLTNSLKEERDSFRAVGKALLGE